MSVKTTNPNQTHEAVDKHEAAKPVAPRSVELTQSNNLESLQHAMAAPGRALPADILALQRSIGNRAATRFIQTKLTVGPAHDRYEQEADRVAEQVMSMPEVRPQTASGGQSPVQRAAEEDDELQLKPLAATITPLVQRAPEEEEELQAKPLVQRDAVPEDEELQTKPLLQREVTPEEEELQAKPLMQRDVAPEEEELQTKPDVQRAATGAGFEVSGDFEQQLDASRSGSSPLPAQVRSFMEPRFGADFSAVRIHTGGKAAQLNRAVQAQAFTRGSDIFFNEGKYNPNSGDGQQLLAHELTHTIQQGAAMARTIQRHPAGTELQNKDAQVAEISAKERGGSESAPIASAATRTEKEKKAEEKAGKEAGKAFNNSQKLTPGAMSLASAEKILQGSYGGFKKIVPGSIVVLANQAACSAKYDQVQIARGVLRPDGSPWKIGDCALDDTADGVLTEGFAEGGVVYVNGETTLVTATAHEILHNNTEPNFRAKAGETFNEGVTETLARKALSEVGIKVPSVTAYPEQVKLTKLLIDLVGIDVVEKAYFENVQELVRMYNRKGSSTWNKLVEAAEALDTDKVKIALTRGFGT